MMHSVASPTLRVIAAKEKTLAKIRYARPMASITANAVPRTTIERLELART
jgi:hypothetical protein